MPSSLRALALALPFVLAACGGGGGGTPTAPQPQAVALTESNAKPVSANALDAAENTSATRGAAGLPTGVQIDSADGGTPMLQAIAETARLAVGSISAARLPVGVALSESVPCTFGGSLLISGNVASASSISVGDTVTLTATNCALSAGTSTAVLNGAMTMTFATASTSLSPPFHIIVTVAVTNMSVTTGGVSVVGNGDVRLDWNAVSSTSQTLSASGTTMSSRETINGVTHTTTLNNFTQVLTISGSTYTGTVSATVQTDSSKLGTGTVSYAIGTPTPVVWNPATRTATAGVIKVVGANNSQLLITINADGTVTIQLDANGDGSYEKTITSTVAELAGLI